MMSSGTRRRTIARSAAILAALLFAACAPPSTEPPGIPAPTRAPMQAEGVSPSPSLPPTLPPARESVLALREINPDAVGFLTVEGTAIAYPVARGGDNTYYLSRSFTGEPDRHGAIFLDSALSGELLARHTLLHGHHMRDGSMFHDLELFKGEAFFRAHTEIDYDTLYYGTRWRIFSVYLMPADEPVPLSFATESDFIAYANSIRDRSLFPCEEEFSADDVLLTLNTCSYEYESAHTLVCAKLIDIA